MRSGWSRAGGRGVEVGCGVEETSKSPQTPWMILLSVGCGYIKNFMVIVEDNGGGLTSPALIKLSYNPHSLSLVMSPRQ